MKRLSINNGRTFIDPEVISDVELEYAWPALVEAMDLRTSTETHDAVAPCSNRAFLAAYLERAPSDLIIG